MEVIYEIRFKPRSILLPCFDNIIDSIIGSCIDQSLLYKLYLCFILSLILNMKRYLIDKFFFTRWYRYWLSWQDFCVILKALHQKADLEQLTAWAKRRRLKPPFKHYKTLLYEVEMKLFYKRVRFRALSFWAEIVFEVIKTFSPSPVYKKGWAGRYSLRNS
jgi:hypothetical protein